MSFSVTVSEKKRNYFLLSKTFGLQQRKLHFFQSQIDKNSSLPNLRRVQFACRNIFLALGYENVLKCVLTFAPTFVVTFDILSISTEQDKQHIFHCIPIHGCKGRKYVNGAYCT